MCINAKHIEAKAQKSEGDFLFSTFGGGNRVVVVQGFVAPPPPPPPGVVPEPTTLVLMGLGLAGLFMIRTRK